MFGKGLGTKQAKKRNKPQRCGRSRVLFFVVVDLCPDSVNRKPGSCNLGLLSSRSLVEFCRQGTGSKDHRAGYGTLVSVFDVVGVVVGCPGDGWELMKQSG